MRFSYDELLCFNSITQGPVPFGIKIKRTPDQGEMVVKRTQERLREKQILDEENHLTREGAVFVQCYEWYRNSEHHLIFNQMRIALLKNGECVVLYPAEGGYEMLCTDHGRLIMALLRESPYMQQDENGERGRWQGYPYDEWSGFMKREIKGSLMVGEYEGSTPVKERIFGWTQKQGYVYNLQRERCKKMTPKEMRVELLKVLRLWERQEEIRAAAVK